jgi:hypothetical protein
MHGKFLQDRGLEWQFHVSSKTLWGTDCRKIYHQSDPKRKQIQEGKDSVQMILQSNRIQQGKGCNQRLQIAQ